MRFALLLFFASTLLLSQTHKLGPIAISGSIRTRTEMWDWFGDNPESSYAYSGNIARMSFSQSFKKWDWQIEAAMPILAALPASSATPAPQGLLGLGANYYTANKNSQYAAMVFAKQANVRFKGLFGNAGASLKLGRFEFNDATEITPNDAALAAVKASRISQRLIGTFGWTHVGRSFDGFHFANNGRKVNFTLVGSFPTRGVFQVDGWGFLRVGTVYASLNGQHNGKRHAGDWRVLANYYQDFRRVLKTDNRPAAVRQGDLNNIRIWSFGGHYLHATQTASGPLDFMAWGVGQTGDWGRIGHRGYAAAFEGGWQPKVLPRLKPWIRGGWFKGSGDNNPSDQTHNTFFQLLPTPRPFARFPFFDLINNEDILGMVTWRPHKLWTIKNEFHALRLSERGDLWFLGGGAFQPWSFGYIGRPSGGGKGLANLYDVSVDWQATKNTVITGYYGHTTAHSVIRNIYPKSPNGHFGYLEVSYKF